MDWVCELRPALSDDFVEINEVSDVAAGCRTFPPHWRYFKDGGRLPVLLAPPIVN